MVSVNPSSAKRPVLEFRDVRISFQNGSAELNVIPALNMAVGAGEAFGLVGESGSGKSTIAFAAMRYLSEGGKVTRGQILFQGTDILQLSSANLRTLRGKGIGMVYQDPMASLNPLMTVGDQLAEVPLIHDRVSRRAARERAIEMLTEVQLSDPEGIFLRYSHQLSGGQQQRIVIAMALIARPKMLILDEPTTGLDATVEAAILRLIGDLRAKYNIGVLLISHNLNAIKRVCDRVAVLYAGEIVEQGTIQEVLVSPRHPYTRGLLNCLPGFERDKKKGPLSPIPGQFSITDKLASGCRFAARCLVKRSDCEVSPVPLIRQASSNTHIVRCLHVNGRSTAAEAPRTASYTCVEGAAEPTAVLKANNLVKSYRARRGGFFGSKHVATAVQSVSIFLSAGATLAIVGESGSGKSTVARILSGLEAQDAGEVTVYGVPVGPVESRSKQVRARLQMIFQDPDSTLNPSHTVGYTLSRAVRTLRGIDRKSATAEISGLLAAVGLEPEIAHRRPMGLSGGQKQRVAIARALAGKPDIIIADEPTSALDVSVQATIINVLMDIQGKTGLALLFISHDLALVRYLADEVIVLRNGEIVDQGTASKIFKGPLQPYTEMLVNSSAMYGEVQRF